MIWCCNSERMGLLTDSNGEDWPKRSAFDTRQYPHIMWTSTEHLRDQLIARILGRGAESQGLTCAPLESAMAKTADGFAQKSFTDLFSAEQFVEQQYLTPEIELQTARERRAAIRQRYCDGTYTAEDWPLDVSRREGEPPLAHRLNSSRVRGLSEKRS